MLETFYIFVETDTFYFPGFTDEQKYCFHFWSILSFLFYINNFILQYTY